MDGAVKAQSREGAAGMGSSTGEEMGVGEKSYDVTVKPGAG